MSLPTLTGRRPKIHRPRRHGVTTRLLTTEAVRVSNRGASRFLRLASFLRTHRLLLSEFRSTGESHQDALSVRYFLGICDPAVIRRLHRAGEIADFELNLVGHSGCY